MAQEFLDQLLRMENTVKVDEQETCMVCLESYGTLNSSTGAIEVQVRLPCSHLVGTICIATWLRDNNSCPACRATFFPAQPRPYLEYGIINDRPSANTWRMGGPDERVTLEICDWLCEELNLASEVSSMAQLITRPLSRMLRGHFHSPECKAAVSVFIAWFLLNPGFGAGSVDILLPDVTHRTRVGEEHIRSTYRHIYPNRMELIDADLPPGLARLHMEGILAFLPSPNPEDSIASSEEGENDREDEISERELGDLAEISEQLSAAVGGDEDLFDIVEDLAEQLSAAVGGDEDLFDIVEDLAEQILNTMDDESELADRSEQLRGAVCTFMACHLMGAEISYSDVARIHGVSERLLREAYAYIFPRRNNLIEPETIKIMGIGNLERVLSALPALNWPSL